MVKKGIVFSTISILLVLFFVFIFSTIYTEYIESSDDFYNTKASAIGNYYEKLVDYYIPVVLSNAGHSALSVMVNFTGENQSFIPPDKFQEVYQSLVMNGTFDCNFNGLNPGCVWSDDYLKENSLDSWFYNFSVNSSDSISTLSDKTYLFTDGDDLQISVNSSKIAMYHDSPWTIVIEAYVDIKFNSSQFIIDDIAKKIKVKFPITNLRNPPYLVYSDNALNITYKNTTQIFNVWNLTLLDNAIKTHRFYANKNAPDFLMRLQNLTGSSEFGALSFIDPVWINATGPFSYLNFKERRSFTDSDFFTTSDCYLSDNSQDYLYNISGISDKLGFEGFRLDFNNTVKYLGVDFSYSVIDVVCSN